MAALRKVNLERKLFDMPFKKIGPNKYVSPSGRKFTEKQVKLYHATDGFKNMRKKPNNLRPPKRRYT